MIETLTRTQSRPASTTEADRKEQAAVAALMAQTSDGANFFQAVMQSVTDAESNRVRFQYD